MTQLIYAAILAVMVSTAAPAKADDLSQAALLMTGAVIGASAAGNVDSYRQGYYASPDPLRITRPQYNVIGGVMPLSKGGSHNPYRTEITDSDGNTTEVTEWTDYRGNKHIEVQEY